MQTGREAVKRAIERKNPDRVPRMLDWFADETIEKYGKGIIDEIKDRYPDDIIMATLGKPYSFSPRTDAWYVDGVDEFGVKRIHAAGGVGLHRHSSKLDDIGYLDEYLEKDFPDPWAPGRFDRAKMLRERYPDRYIVGHWWQALFESVADLRGMENYLCDLIIDRDNIMRLERKLCNFWKEVIKGFAESGMDGIFFSDDVGDQRSMILSPQTWREVLKPLYREMIDVAHERGLHVLLHTCGNVKEIIPDIIEAGFDAIHPIQPGCMNAREIAGMYRGKISFFGGIDVQNLLPNGTPEQVDRAMKDMMEIFNSPEGGFIAAPANSIMPETPMENIKALFEAVEKYSKSGK